CPGDQAGLHRRRFEIPGPPQGRHHGRGEIELFKSRGGGGGRLFLFSNTLQHNFQRWPTVISTSAADCPRHFRIVGDSCSSLGQNGPRQRGRSRFCSRGSEKKGPIPRLLL